MSKYKLIVAVVFLSCVLGRAAVPTSTSVAEEDKIFDGFRSVHFMSIAADIQRLTPGERYRRLQEFARDRVHLYDTFVLFRLLYEPKPGEELRRPLLGRPSFIGEYSDAASKTDRHWPLEPIAIYDETPILVVRGYILSGAPEDPLKYLEYCSFNGLWRSKKIPDRDLAQRRKTVSDFAASLVDLTKEDKDWLLAQAEDK